MTATSERVAFTIAETERTFHLPPGTIRLQRRRHTEALARAVVSLLLRDVFDMSSTEIGAELQLDHTTVVRHWKRLGWMQRVPELGGPIGQVRQELLRRYPPRKCQKRPVLHNSSTAASTGGERWRG